MDEHQGQSSSPETSVGGSSTTKIIIVVIALIILAGGAFFFLSRREVSAPTTTQQTQTQSTETAQSTPTSEPLAQGETKRFSIEASNFKFSLPEIRVKKGDTVKINFSVREGFHDFVIDEFNVRSKQHPAGESETIDFVVDKTGSFEYYCSVGNHRQMGMVGKLIVE
jgi:plastocyanin